MKKEMCQQIIDNPKIAEEEYEKDMNSEEISLFPFGFLQEMQDLSELDRIRYGIIQAKYGMNLEKAKMLCSAFGYEIDQIKQSEDTRIIKELGKNNDRADFNMILTSLGGIYFHNHNYDDLKADWDRPDKNHTISCSYIGNDLNMAIKDFEHSFLK